MTVTITRAGPLATVANYSGVLNTTRTITLSNGGYAVFWADDRGTYVQRYDAAGAPQGIYGLGGSRLDTVGLTELADGSLLVAINSGYYGLYFHRVLANGQRVEPFLALNYGQPTDVDALPNGGFVAAWAVDNSVRSQYYNVNFAPVGDQRQLTPSGPQRQDVSATTLEGGKSLSRGPDTTNPIPILEFTPNFWIRTACLWARF